METIKKSGRVYLVPSETTYHRCLSVLQDKLRAASIRCPACDGPSGKDKCVCQDLQTLKSAADKMYEEMLRKLGGDA
jgi:hypothetical protein